MEFTEWLDENEEKLWHRFDKIPSFVLKKMRLTEYSYGEFLNREWEKWRKKNDQQVHE